MTFQSLICASTLDLRCSGCSANAGPLTVPGRSERTGTLALMLVCNIQGFPKKTPVSRKNIPDLVRDDKEGKQYEISTFNIVAIGRLLWKTLYTM